MMNYKMIIFDFDGTLAESYPWFAENINNVAELFKFKKISDADTVILRNKNSKEILHYLEISSWKIPFIAFYMRKLMSKNLDKISLFENLDFILTSLKSKNLKLAVVSSNSEENIKKILGPNVQHFDYFLCGSSLFGKPKKFQKLKLKTGYAASEILCIGDEIRDIDAAKSVGMHAGAVTWGYTNKEALENAQPQYLFESLPDILRIF